MRITAKEAKKILDSGESCVLLDVRDQEEFDEKHIPGAILIPGDELEDRAWDELPDENQLILVYCSTGRRSSLAAQTLEDLGYTNVKDLGGIASWPYETE